MAAYIKRPTPLITPRIEFSLAPPAPLPLITPRIEFTPERLSVQKHGGGSRSARQQQGLGVHFQDHDPDSPHVDAGPSSQGRSASNPPTQADPGAGMLLRRSGKSPMIPKPPGEPGRPGSGGHCVETALIEGQNWPKQQVDKLTEAVRAEARRQLDMTVSFRNQNKAKIQKLCDNMMNGDKWPELKNYDDCWPVRSMLKLTLKYGAEASRRANSKELSKRVRAALSPEV
ncbi:hypothetical protein BD779DRAFT_1473894 [Infundibulicybe gibba]|nr:hypothetical protein BD779DRAFT_1473894 [Infundibulicybe gibba]